MGKFVVSRLLFVLLACMISPSYGAPLVQLLQPNGGVDATVYSSPVVLYGCAGAENPLKSITWTNDTSGQGGLINRFDRLQDKTNGWWRSPPMTLFSGDNTCSVWAVDSLDNTSTPDTIVIVFDTNGLPSSLGSYPSGAVFATAAKANGQFTSAFLDGRRPYFSWSFGDALNTASVGKATAIYMGPAQEVFTRAIAVGDLTGDGLPDVVEGNYFGSTGGPNTVVINNGVDPADWARVSLGSPLADMTRSVALGDLTGDGRPDVVVGNYTQQNYVVINNGCSPETWERVNLGSELRDATYVLAIGDLTGDGRADVVVGNYQQASYVLINDGTSPSNWVREGLGTNPVSAAQSLAIGDLTGDGLADVAVGNYAQANFVLVNDGASPTNWARISLGTNLVDQTTSIAIGDLTGDRRLDVAVMNYAQPPYVIQNNGNSVSNWVRERLGLGVSSANCMGVADISGDGRLDIPLGSSAGAYLYLNAGASSTNWPLTRANPSVTSASAAGLAIYDVTGDGRPDYVQGDYNLSSHPANYVLVHNEVSMPNAQCGYWLQVARSAADLENGDLFWDSGVVASPISGDGAGSVHQGLACAESGEYYWRVKVFSSSGYQSDWSETMRYVIPTNNVILTVERPLPPAAWTTGSLCRIEGWVSEMAVGLVWTNEATGIGGEIDVPGEWTQTVALASGSNRLVFVAAGASGPSRAQALTVVRADSDSGPVILVPNSGQACTTAALRVRMSGTLRWPLDPYGPLVWWSNTANGVVGATGRTNHQSQWPATDCVEVPLQRWTDNVVHVWCNSTVSEPAEAAISIGCYDTQAPVLEIDRFNGALGLTTFTNTIALSGTMSDNGGIRALVWTNVTTGIGGALTIEWAWGQTNGRWQVSALSLVEGAQEIRVWAIDYFDQLSTPDTLTVTYDASGLPVDVTHYPTGVVCAAMPRINGQLLSVSLSDYQPEFSWQFGDGLNAGIASNMVRWIPGPALADMTRDLAIGDVTGDGWSDVVVGNQTQQNYVLVNNGVNFTNWAKVALGSSLNDNTRSVAIGDLTDDGRPDIVAGNWGEPSWVFINDGGSISNWGRLQLGSLTNYWIRSVAIADVTGDGRPDVVAGNGTTTAGAQNLVFVNDGGNPSNWASVDLGSPTNDWTVSIAVDDFTGDGLPDVVVGNYTNQSFALINNGGSPETWPRYTLGSPKIFTTMSVAIGDVTGDGRPDIALANELQRTCVLINNGGTPDTWSRENLGNETVAATYKVCIADLTGDGRPDASLACYNAQNYVFVNDNGSPENWGLAALGSGTNDLTVALAVGDLNADGRLDIAVGNAYRQNFLLENNATAMPHQQTAYQIQVARSVQHLADGIFFWDSGVTSSARVGDGVASIRQGAACTNNGDYYVRTRVFSDSGYQSVWSAPARYTIPVDQIYFLLHPPGQVSSTATVGSVSGWVSWNATNIVWSNEVSGASGSFVATGDWTQDVSVVVGYNTIRFTAHAEGDVAAMQIATLLRTPPPSIAFHSPTGGVVYTNTVVLSGAIGGMLPLIRWSWTNITAGLGGDIEVQWVAGQTSGLWRTPVLGLVAGPQQFGITAVDASNNVSTMSTVWLTYDDSGLPANLVDYVTGAVYATSLKVNRQWTPITINDPRPVFSWQFGDALNDASSIHMSRTTAGSPMDYDLSGAAVGDLDGDGRADLVMGSGASSLQTYVWLNNGGDPSAWPRVTLGAPEVRWTTAVAIGDLNGDRRPDVVQVNWLSRPYVYLNNGRSPDAWPRVYLGNTVHAGQDAAIADLNRDGRPDVYLAVQNGFPPKVVVNNGGSPDTWPMVTVYGSIASAAYSAAAGDLTRDGYPDVAEIAPTKDPSVFINVNNGTNFGVWPRTTLLSGACGGRGVCVGDVNNDGWLDVGNSSWNSQSRVYINLWPSFTNVNLGRAIGTAIDLEFADLTGDGRLDAVAGNSTPTQNTVFVSNGGLPDTWPEVQLGSFPTNGGSSAICVGDLTGDSRLDVIGPALNAKQTYLWLHNPTSMPYVQIAYQVQVAADADDLAAGANLIWDSGITNSSDIGDGVRTIRQGVPCPAAGIYHWRVRTFSSSGYQSPWSVPAMYEIPTNQAYLAIWEPAPQGGSATSLNVSGWTSWNVTDLAWTNLTAGLGGVLPAGSPWTQGLDLMAGTNTLWFSALADGGLAASQQVTLCLDNWPSVTITNPPPATNLPASSNIEIDVGLAAAGATVTQVVFYASSSEIGAGLSEPFSFNWTNAAAGIYALRARVFDDQGRVGLSASVGLRVNGPPDVSITQPTNEAICNVATPVNMAATAVDVGGLVTQVSFYANAAWIGTDTASPYTCQWSGMATGEYVLTAVAWDDLGVPGTSAEVRISVRNDPPSVSIVQPDSGTVFGVPTNVLIVAQASDPDGTVTQVVFYADADPLHTFTGSPYAYGLNLSTIGSYILTAVAWDDYGNCRTSLPVQVEAIDPPRVSLTSPEEGWSYEAPAAMTVSAQASSALGTVTQVEFYADGAWLHADAVAPYGFTWSGAATGTYALTARAYDDLGCSAVSAPVAIQVIPQVEPAPSPGPGLPLSVDAASSTWRPINPRIYGMNIANWCQYYYYKLCEPWLTNARVSVVRYGATNIERYNYKNNRMYNVISKTNQFVPMSWSSFVDWVREDLHAEPFLQASVFGHVAADDGAADYNVEQTPADIADWVTQAGTNVPIWGVGNEPFIAWKLEGYHGTRGSNESGYSYNDGAHGDQIYNEDIKYDSYFPQFIRVAEAIRSISPGSTILGPTPANWWLYWSTDYSPFCPAKRSDPGSHPDDNGWYMMSSAANQWNPRVFPDRAGSPDMIGWEQNEKTGVYNDNRTMCQFAKRMGDYAVSHGGTQVCNYLDFHRYMNLDNDASAVQETRDLWDPDYQSYDKETGGSGTKTKILSRFQNIIDHYNTNLNLSLSEYDYFYWQGYPEERQIPAIGQLDYLGAFQRCGVQMACNWYMGEPDQSGGGYHHAADSAKQAMFKETGEPNPKYWAFKLMSDHFRGQSIAAVSTDNGQFSVHAELNTNTMVLSVAAAYKGEYVPWWAQTNAGAFIEGASPSNATLVISNFNITGVKQVLRFGRNDPQLVHMDRGGVNLGSGPSFSYRFEPLSIYLFQFHGMTNPPAEQAPASGLNVYPARVDFGPYNTGLELIEVVDEHTLEVLGVTTNYTQTLRIVNNRNSNTAWSVSNSSDWLAFVGSTNGSAKVTDLVYLQVTNKAALAVGVYSTDVSVATSEGSLLVPVTMEVIPGRAGGETRIFDADTGSLAHNWNTAEPYSIGFYDGHGNTEDRDGPYIYVFSLDYAEKSALGGLASMKVEFDRANGDTADGRLYTAFGSYGHVSIPPGPPEVWVPAGSNAANYTLKFDIKSKTEGVGFTKTQFLLVITDDDQQKGKPDVLLSSYDANIEIEDGYWQAIAIPLGGNFYDWHYPGGQNGSLVNLDFSRIRQMEFCPWAGRADKRGALWIDNIRIETATPDGRHFPVAVAGQSARLIGTNETVTLTATNSYDPDGGALTYAWQPASGLSASNTADVVFTPTGPGDYVFDLVVADSTGLKSRNPAQATIRVIPTLVGESLLLYRDATLTNLVSGTAADCLDLYVKLACGAGGNPDQRDFTFAAVQSSDPYTGDTLNDVRPIQIMLEETAADSKVYIGHVRLAAFSDDIRDEIGCRIGSDVALQCVGLTNRITVGSQAYGYERYVDHIENGDARYNYFGGVWNAYDDRENNNSSTVFMAGATNGASAFSSQSMRGWGTLRLATTGQPIHVFGGIMTKLTPYTNDGSFAVSDLSLTTGLRGVSFWLKGNGKKLSVVLKSNAITNYDDYVYTLAHTPCQWKQYILLFTDFTQEGWGGEAVNRDEALRQVNAIQFKFASKLDNETNEVFVDDLALFGGQLTYGSNVVYQKDNTNSMEGYAGMTTNSSFANAGSSTLVIPGWSLAGDARGENWSGSGEVVFEQWNGSAGSVEQTIAGISEGNAYTFEARMKKESGFAGAAYMELIWLTAGDLAIQTNATPDLAPSMSSTDGAESWHTTGYLTAPGGAVKVKARIRAASVTAEHCRALDALFYGAQRPDNDWITAWSNGFVVTYTTNRADGAKAARVGTTLAHPGWLAGFFVAPYGSGTVMTNFSDWSAVALKARRADNYTATGTTNARIRLSVCAGTNTNPNAKTLWQNVDASAWEDYFVFPLDRFYTVGTVDDVNPAHWATWTDTWTDIGRILIEYGPAQEGADPHDLFLDDFRPCKGTYLH
ncbi:MAG TPA: hypothetical protein DCZ95_16480 [Verrucomicrobia bacterium]|nr:MAG: hypothetical protein A2X46_15680 [Lentisphaerae bacterium GWF2_57_35]HBA85679.1 hypothetical protein [Verrucomicrobiota bacterium]